MSKRTIVVCVLFVFAFAGTIALARPGYYDMFIKKYPKVSGTRLDFCVCHYNKGGGGARNPFGNDFSGKGYSFEAIEALDSDKDGFTNIEEITALTYPGDPNDFPPDTVKPTIEITQPKQDEILTTPEFKVKGTAIDDRKVKEVTVTLDDQSKTVTISSGIFEVPFTVAKGGKKTVKAVAKDAAGNSDESTVSFYVRLPDKEPPSVTIMFPAENATVDNLPIRVTGTAEDDNSVVQVEFSLDGGKVWQQAEGTDKWTAPIITAPEGEITVKVRATDDSGNVGLVSTRRFFLKFPDVPTPIISYPLPGMTIDTSLVTVSGTFSSPATYVRVKLDDGKFMDTKIDGNFWMIELSLSAPGEHMVEACAFDRFNRQSNECAKLSFTFKLRDSEPPSISIDSPKEGGEYELGLVQFSGTASDSSGVNYVELSLDAENWLRAQGTSKWSYSHNIQKPGNYTLFVRAADAVGNITKNYSQIKFTVVGPLEVRIDKPDEGLLNDGILKVKVAFTRRPDTVPTFSISGSTATMDILQTDPQNYEVSANLGGGKSELYVKAGLKGVIAEGRATFTYKLEIMLAIGSKTMIVNGMQKTIPSPATIIGGRTYIPFRSIGEAIRAEVFWNDQLKEATYKLGTRSFVLTLNSTVAQVDGRQVAMLNSPIIIGGRLMVPVRSMGDLLGASTAYDGVLKVVTLTMPM